MTWTRELAAPAKVALLVGTVLCLVNHSYTAGDPARIALNYLVPFLVSSHSRFSLLRKLGNRRSTPRPDDTSPS